MTENNILRDNKKFAEILNYLKKFIKSASIEVNAIKHTNSMLSRSKPMYSFPIFTGKELEQEIKNTIGYNNLEEAKKNQLKYFFVIVSEPFGPNEFPDFAVGIGETKKHKNLQDLYWMYLENKTYTNNYSFGTSTVDSLLDNLLTRIGAPTRIENAPKRIDKLTTAVLVEKFDKEQKDNKEIWKVEDIEYFFLYQLIGFNSNNGFTTKNGEKNLMIVPLASAASSNIGSIEDWLRVLHYIIKNESNEQIIKALDRLKISKDIACEIIKDRIMNPFAYQDNRFINFEYKNNKLF